MPAGDSSSRELSRNGPSSPGSSVCSGLATAASPPSFGDRPARSHRVFHNDAYTTLTSRDQMTIAVGDIDRAAALLQQSVAEVKRVIVGQEHMVERTIVALLARGHCLLEGVPGVAKTL